jgi:pyridoxamine 5'-phosphate oxidase
VDLEASRVELERIGLDEADVDADPFVQFRRWFDVAVESGVHQPEAMVVSTVSVAGAPSSRHVLLRGTDGGFTFYTNYRSQKAREIEADPHVALCFPWIAIGRQVRVVGRAERTPASVSDEYFASRPRDSQLGAWASDQSAVLTDRGELERQFAARQAEFEPMSVPRPPHWGGLRVVPAEIEFWQGRRSRLHDRLRYRRDRDDWIIERLAP